MPRRARASSCPALPSSGRPDPSAAVSQACAPSPRGSSRSPGLRKSKKNIAECTAGNEAAAPSPMWCSVELVNDSTTVSEPTRLRMAAISSSPCSDPTATHKPLHLLRLCRGDEGALRCLVPVYPGLAGERTAPASPRLSAELLRGAS